MRSWSPRIVTVCRKSLVMVAVTKVIAGPGREEADCAHAMSRCFIVEVGFKRQKLTTCVWAVVGAAWAAASAAMSSMAAWMPPIVVGRKGPSSSRALLRADWQRLRHLFATMCAARWREVLEAPP